MLTLFTALVPVFTLFSLGQSPTRPGGGGATPTMKIHKRSILYRSVSEPNQSKLNETKPNETKKKNTISEKPKV